jgi:hypothetical protein
VCVWVICDVRVCVFFMNLCVYIREFCACMGVCVCAFLPTTDETRSLFSDQLQTTMASFTSASHSEKMANGGSQSYTLTQLKARMYVCYVLPPVCRMASLGIDMSFVFVGCVQPSKSS